MAATVDFTNPCGGKRWRILGSGLIEVEGEGTPTIEPGSSSFKLMAQTWRNFGADLARSGDRYGVPVPWMLAVATMETGFLSADPEKQSKAVSPVGAIGVMQIMPFNAVSFGLTGPDELYVPSKNIEVGAKILAKDNERTEAGGLPGISAMYNSGKLCTSDPNRNEWMLLADANYPRRVIEWNNSAIQSGLVSPLSGNALALVGAAIGAALGLAVSHTVTR